MVIGAENEVISLPQKLIKRDGREVEFDKTRIAKAFEKAGQATEKFNIPEAQLLTHQVIKVISHRYGDRHLPDIESVQDICEKERAPAIESYILGEIEAVQLLTELQEKLAPSI